ncbi:hypothetical protein [Ornithinimicrobium kibberense]|uniref:hypothetical protein n=1 Tax=Ornithinimicrobium kibberense TaxID=282060 RepID=UPI0036099646
MGSTPSGSTSRPDEVLPSSYKQGPPPTGGGQPAPDRTSAQPDGETAGVRRRTGNAGVRRRPLDPGMRRDDTHRALIGPLAGQAGAEGRDVGRADHLTGTPTVVLADALLGGEAEVVAAVDVQVRHRAIGPALFHPGPRRHAQLRRTVVGQLHLAAVGGHDQIETDADHLVLARGVDPRLSGLTRHHECCSDRSRLGDPAHPSHTFS